VFYNEDEAIRAREQGRETWDCKIGKAKNAGSRISDSAFIAKSPVIGLLIKCADEDAVEKVLHNTLRAAGVWRKLDGGQEWYQTSPRRIENFYRAWLPQCRTLGIGHPGMSKADDSGP